jgi:DNA-binding CsgD family transcriptional regulator
MISDEIGQIRRNGLWLTALVADAAGDVDEAMLATAEAVEVLDRPGPSFAGLADVADEVVFVRMALRADRPDLAARALAVAERRAAANPAYPMAAAAALHARALVQADESCLHEAVQALAGSERPLVRASAHEDLARMVAGNRPREAVKLLDEALTAYTAAGAEHDAARVRRRLRDLGVRRRRAAAPAGPRHGLGSLTPAELDVARRVAQGGTNRHVAAQMFVSPHTVNTHLRNAFLKLGVRSRVELARRLAQEDQ